MRRLAIVSYLRLAVLALALCFVEGCGPSHPKTIHITGRVTIDGNAPGEVGQLYFTPKKTAEGYTARPASGAFTADGVYRVMSWAPDDGLVPGDYSISVSPADPNKTAIPKKYQLNTSSGLEVNVPVDQGKVDFNIDMHTK